MTRRLEEKLTRVGLAKLGGVLAGLLAAMGAVGVLPAAAGVPAAHWTIRAYAAPSRFAPEHVYDKYVILVTNTGGAATNAEDPVVIKAALGSGVISPEGLLQGLDWASGEGMECSKETVQCEERASVPPDDTLEVQLPVKASAGSGEVVSSFTVSGGGVEPASQTVETSIGPGLLPFAPQSFGFAGVGLDGGAETQASGHPYEQTTSFEVLQNGTGDNESEQNYRPTRNPRNVSVTLPAGFVGNPLAAPQCTLSKLQQGEFRPVYTERYENVANCPKGSRVGRVTLVFGRGQGGPTGPGSITPLYNLVPEAGHAAELGFTYAGEYAIVMYADLVHTSGGYRLRVTVPGVPALALDGAVVTLFGDPGVRNQETAQNSAFLRNPSQCTNEPLSAKLEVNSWEEPHEWIAAESVAFPRVGGCEALRFEPEIHVTPETTQADTPSGYEVDLKIPRAETPWNVLPSPELKDATVALPAGVSVSPSAATGLEGCEATGPRGIDIPGGMPHPDEAGEGEAIGPDGLSHLIAGNCPAGSQIGDVEILTPLLAAPLTGHLFVAQPRCGGAGQLACTTASATNGELLGLYLEAAGSGVVVKLAGSVAADPVTGQLTARFLENPEIPFSELKIKLNSGPRAPLANPQSCGVFTTTTDLVPWSSPVTPDARPSSSFEVGGCPASAPFNPGFAAGSVTPAAGVYSAFALSFSRQDREQDLAGLSQTLPTGLLARLAGVPLCPDAQASAGDCPAASQIGTVSAGVGAGAHPFYTQGRVYLTGPYNGGPFGESVVIPAVAGPFNLGNVVVRGSIRVDPHTAQASVVSDQFPSILDGIPLRLRSVAVTLDRPGFTFNPTDCAQQQLGGVLSSTQGARVAVSSPFAVAGCAKLPFKPRFSASTVGKASRANGASLDVKVSSKGGPQPGGGEANIRSVKVNLPKQLPSRLKTLQKACLAAQFEANPAGCPKESDVGSATAVTPVLASPLRGPAYLVSHGGAAFPDLEIVLQGEGVTLVLDGHTDIKRNITSSTFSSVPDAPISSFELKLPTGKFSVLGANVPLKANYSLCGQTLAMPTRIVGQNGAVITQSTRIATTGCAKPKALTRAQKLARALKACRKKDASQRAGCQRLARKRYAPVKHT